MHRARSWRMGVKERKKGNASKFYIAFLFDGDELTKDNMSGGA